jgi:hypothetical protein
VTPPLYLLLAPKGKKPRDEQAAREPVAAE